MAVFRKPNNVSADGYDFLESGYFWRLRVPVGQWRTVALHDTSDVYNVISNNDGVSPRKLPSKTPAGGCHNCMRSSGELKATASWALTGSRRQVRDAVEQHLRHEPTKASKSRIKRLRGLSHPQYRLRVGDAIRVFYDVTEEVVQVLAIVPKSEVDAWLAKHGEGDETSSSVGNQR